MNGFDKFCGFFAFLLGLVFLVLGVLGLFAGCKAYFTLPPVAGVIPAFVGWGIVRAVYLAWDRPAPPPSTPELLPPPPAPTEVPWTPGAGPS
jgi:hypothetical protein